MNKNMNTKYFILLNLIIFFCISYYFFKLHSVIIISKTLIEIKYFNYIILKNL